MKSLRKKHSPKPLVTSTPFIEKNTESKTAPTHQFLAADSRPQDMDKSPCPSDNGIGLRMEGENQLFANCTTRWYNWLMRAFQYRSFRRWAKDEGLSGSNLLAVIIEMEAGLTGDNLGGNVYKKRVKLEGRGKRGGARTIIAYKSHEKAFFIVGFAKNEKDDIDSNEELALKRLAKELFAYTDDQLKKAVEAQE